MINISPILKCLPSCCPLALQPANIVLSLVRSNNKLLSDWSNPSQLVSSWERERVKPVSGGGSRGNIGNFNASFSQSVSVSNPGERQTADNCPSVCLPGFSDASERCYKGTSSRLTKLNHTAIQFLFVSDLLMLL